MNITPIYLTVKDKSMLASSFMPFLKNGGLFLKGFTSPMSSPVGLIIEIPSDHQKYIIDGTVVYSQQNGPSAGVGIHFDNSLAAVELKQKIEQLLVGVDRSKIPLLGI
jgi:type IV pilus assembly protein PilZ